jgi:two-component system, OmpR family, response regulator ChvI
MIHNKRLPQKIIVTVYHVNTRQNTDMTTSSSSSPKRKRKILLVDDEPDLTLTLKMGLEDSGLFEVDTFNDPQLALSNFKPDYYDFLLIDIKMPYLSGYELYDKLRKIDSRVKSCFITAYEMNYQALREQFPTLEMECYAKPLEISELIRKINKELQQEGN